MGLLFLDRHGGADASGENQFGIKNTLLSVVCILKAMDCLTPRRTKKSPPHGAPGLMRSPLSLLLSSLIPHRPLGLLVVPWASHTWLCLRTFARAVPITWNTLPLDTHVATASLPRVPA